MLSRRLLICLFVFLALDTAILATASVLPESQKAGKSAEQTASVAVLGYGALGSQADGKRMDAATFARQMEFLKERNIRVISLSCFLDWLKHGKALPAQHCVLITLDETDAETCRIASKELTAQEFPFVLFADGHSFAGTAGSGVLRIRKMQVEGADIGSYTMNRPSADTWKAAALSGPSRLKQMIRQELEDSAVMVKNHCGACRVLAYPEGYADAGILGAMQHAGYEAAFCMQPGKVTEASPHYRLHRYMVQGDEDFLEALSASGNEKATLAAQLNNLPLHQVAIVSETLPPTDKQPAVPTEEIPALRPLPDFEDDEVAEEVEDEEALPAPMPAEHTERYLTKRTENGDWVTERFHAPLVPRDKTRVAVLGYHNFSNTKAKTEMRMRTSEFCRQMQYIRDAGLSVITMEDFLEWRFGTRQLPERCVLITLDDGWKSVYTDAYPVMRAYGYPFTLFLYTSYVQVQGDSLTKEQIQEMMANGATIGSHSSNHLYPRMWKRYKQDSEQYSQQVQEEITASGEKLKEWFGNCSTYCYPGGYHTPPMEEALENGSYRAAFTVIPEKVTIEETPYQIHRYMVFGTDSSIFRRAVNFDGEKAARQISADIQDAEERARAFFPAAFTGAKK